MGNSIEYEYINRIISSNNFDDIWARLLLGDLLLTKFKFRDLDDYWYGFVKLSNKPSFERFDYFDRYGGNIIIKPDINKFFLDGNVLKYGDSTTRGGCTVYSQVIRLTEEQMLNILTQEIDEYKPKN